MRDTPAMPRTWTAVAVTVAPALAEAVESFLFDHGAPGLQTEDLGDRTRITAHFSAAAPLDELRRFLGGLSELFPAAAAPIVAVDTIADRAWAESWKEHFPPLTVGERLFVRPPWSAPAPAGRIDIVIHPGMAFGTGHHATTRSCLLWLERALRARPTARVLDLGTGSGILAIAAAKLGAPMVWALDTDPEACAIAAENAARNGVADRLYIDSDVSITPERFEIVVANLLAGALVELVADIAARLEPGGVALGAGVLVAEASAVRAAWRAAGLADDGDVTDDGWVALAARRSA
jgi:ribosomal protein L11 methyltransferase